jgi:hypothetical protein
MESDSISAFPLPNLMLPRKVGPINDLDWRRYPNPFIEARNTGDKGAKWTAMDLIDKASDLLNPGETAMVVFTEGLHLVLHSDGTGTSGNWKIDPKRRVGKVIIYKRDSEATDQLNKVYLADHTGIVGEVEGKRYIIGLQNTTLRGVTDQNWRMFADAGTNPVRYLKK